jgi:hypothetical protein
MKMTKLDCINEIERTLTSLIRDINELDKVFIYSGRLSYYVAKLKKLIENDEFEKDTAAKLFQQTIQDKIEELEKIKGGL